MVGHFTDDTPAPQAANTAPAVTTTVKPAAAKPAAKKSQFVISGAQRTMCRQAIQAQMVDPNSFKWEGSMSDMRRTGVLVYSGTNAFGGRIRETFDCKAAFS